MTFKTLCLAIGATAFMATTAHADETVEIRDFVGTINWTNGPLEADVTDNADKVDVSTRSGLMIDGGIDDIDNQGCKNTYANWSWDWGKKKSEGTYGGYKDLKDYPVIDVTLPEDTTLIVRNSVLFTIGEPNVGSADLELVSCGNVKLGRIDGDLKLISRGSADLDFGEAASADIEIRGSSDIDGGDISGAVVLNSRGSGDVDLGDIGSLTADLRGSGDLDVGDVDGDFAGGSRGSGDIDVGDIRGDMVFVARGSGDLETGDVFADNVEIEVSGSSSLQIDGGEIEALMVKASGSSDITVEGKVTDANLRASGSSEIYVDRVTGVAELKTSGSADIEIDERD